MFIIFAYSVCLVVAQVGLKLLFQGTPSIDSVHSLHHLLGNKYFYIFFAIYLLSLFAWALAISKHDLTFAYSAAFSMSFILFNIASLVFFDSKFNLNSVVGSSIILLGAYIIGRS